MNTRFRDWPFDTHLTPPTSSERKRPVLWQQAGRVDALARIAELRASGIPSFDSDALLVACDSLEAAVEQLARPKYVRIEQCLLLLVHSLELFIRGAPAEIVAPMNLLGQPQWAAKFPKLCRALASSGKDPDAWCQSIWKKECDFRTAFAEVHSIFQFSPNSENRHDDVYTKRNKVVHRGGTTPQKLQFLRSILLEVLPIIDEVLFTVYGFEFENLVGPRVNRELLVAGLFLNMLFVDRRRVNELQVASRALHPFQVAFRLVNEGPLVDRRQAVFREARDPQDEAELQPLFPYLRRPYILGVDSARAAPACRICGDPCMVQFEPRIRENIGMQVVKPLAVCCTTCGLFLTEQFPELTRIHYGYLDSDSLGTELWSELVDQISRSGK